MADIHLTLAAGASEPTYYYDVRISKQLCNKTANAPVFVPVFTLVTYAQVGTITSATGTVTGYEFEAIVNVQGIVTYTPCGSCCAKTQTINQQFTIPFVSASVPSSVSIESGTPINTLVKGNGCNNCCSNIFTCDVPLNFTIIAST